MVLVGVLVVAGVACTPTNNMRDQWRYDPYEASDQFPDGTSARAPVAGTVPRPEGARPVAADATLDEPRPPVTMALLERGHERFDVYCTPCHGRDGYGRGMVVQRGFPPPPSYHSERLRTMPDAEIFDVITHGRATMPAYGPQLEPADRWAVVAFIRALQRSQHAALADVPPAARSSLDQPSHGPDSGEAP